MSLSLNPFIRRRSANTRRLATIVLVAAACAATSGCVSAPAPQPVQDVCAQASLVNPAIGSGIGGTGAPMAGADRSGLGGTGAPVAGVDPGGIGGTGAVAGKPVFGEGGIGGTGIVGVITGFASICVNGVEVHYDTNTPVWDNGRPGSAQQLKVGQVVSVAATGNGAQARARDIAMIHALVGPLDAVDRATGQLRVLGQKVSALEPADLTTLKAGDWVRVSGHRLATGEIAASRIDGLPRPAAGAWAQVRGPVSALAGSSLRVGDTPVNVATLALPAGLAANQELWVSGEWDGRTLLARQVAADPTLQGLGRVNQVLLEGYIHQLGPNQMSLGFQPLQLRQGVQIVGGTQAELAVNRKVQVSGRVGADQRITVERIEFSYSGGAGSDSSGKSGKGSKGSSGKGGQSGSGSGKGSSGSSGSGSSGSGNSGSGSSGSGSSGSGSSGSGSSGSGSSGGGGGGSGK